MAVTGLPEADLVVLPLQRGTYPHVYRVQRDDELIEMLTKAGERFWAEHVLPSVEPPIDGSEAWTQHIKAKFPDSNGVVLEADAEGELEAQNYRVLHRQLAELEKEERAAYNKVIARIGGNEGLRLRDGTLLSFKRNASGGGDHKAVIGELAALIPPDALAQATAQHVRPGARVLRVHEPKIQKLTKRAAAKAAEGA